jgi:large subunit ribosomal protein L29
MAKGTKAEELRKMADDQLTANLLESKQELFNLRFQSATGQLESHGRLRAVRTEIARIYTVMREREMGITPVVETAEGGAA